jgi:hypothetical protein
MNRRLQAALNNLSLKVRPYWDLAIVSPITQLGASIEIDGNLVPAGALIAALNQMNLFNIGDAQSNFQTSAAAAITLTGIQNLTQRLTNGGACTVTLDSAYNIVNLIPSAFSGQTFGFAIAATGATTVAPPTLTDTAVTLAGTTSVLAAAQRWYQGQITQLTTTVGMPTTAGTTFSSLAQVGATNNFTVTLATNTLVPVVGNLIFLNVTTGTLPSGWYPINKVTSATSFVIAAPPGTVWTATAATVGTGIVAPATYSPLITITGTLATATAVITV